MYWKKIFKQYSVDSNLNLSWKRYIGRRIRKQKKVKVCTHFEPYDKKDCKYYSILLKIGGVYFCFKHWSNDMSGLE